MSIHNFLLSALSPESHKLLVSRSTPVAMPLRTVLYEANETPTHAYFMTSGLASIVTSMPDGATAEVSFIGRDKGADPGGCAGAGADDWPDCRLQSAA